MAKIPASHPEDPGSNYAIGILFFNFFIMVLSRNFFFLLNCFKMIRFKKLNDFLKCNDEDIYNFYMNNIPILEFKGNKILNLFKNFKY